jgi:hypothetical protein
VRRRARALAARLALPLSLSLQRAHARSQTPARSPARTVEALGRVEVQAEAGEVGAEREVVEVGVCDADHVQQPEQRPLVDEAGVRAAPAAEPAAAEPAAAEPAAAEPAAASLLERVLLLLLLRQERDVVHRRLHVRLVPHAQPALQLQHLLLLLLHAVVCLRQPHAAEAAEPALRAEARAAALGRGRDAREGGEVLALDRKLRLGLLHRRDGRAVHARRRERLLQRHRDSVRERRKVSHVELRAGGDVGAAQVAEAARTHPTHPALVDHREQVRVLRVGAAVRLQPRADAHHPAHERVGHRHAGLAGRVGAHARAHAAKPVRAAATRVPAQHAQVGAHRRAVEREAPSHPSELLRAQPVAAGVGGRWHAAKGHGAGHHRPHVGRRRQTALLRLRGAQAEPSARGASAREARGE